MSIKNDINKILLKKFLHLEISVVKYSEVQTDNESKRIDSEYFKQAYLENEKILKNLSIGCEKLGNLIYKMTGGATPLGADYPERGIPFLRVQNIMPNYFNLNDIVYISNEDDEFLKRSKLKIKDVLLTITGAYGKAAVVYKDLVGANINQHSVKIEVKNINPYFLATFINSKHGQLQCHKKITGVTRPALDYRAIKNFLIPMFSKEFQLEIETMVKDSHKALENSKKLYKEAEKILYEALGLDAENPLESILSFREKNKVIHNHLKRYKRLNISIRTYKESYLKTGRLDAEYYQVKYDLIENIIKDYSKGYCKLSDIGFFTNGSFIPESFYTEQAKRAYIRIKELSLDSPINMKDCIYINDKFKNSNETIVKENDFVIATIGNTIGKINLITKELEGSFISNNTSRFRLTDKNVNPIFLELLLRNSIVQEQIQREFTQTAQPKISNNSLENIIIPKIDYIIQKKIEYRIKKSLELRDKSKELLENAKVKIENAIIDS